MSDQDHNEPRRRASDAMPGGSGGPSNADLYKLMVDMQRQLDTVLRKQEEHATAFVTNDLGKPDLEGHRLYHSRSIKAAEQMDGYKSGMTKTVLDWAVKGLLALLLAGLLVKLGGPLAAPTIAGALK